MTLAETKENNLRCVIKVDSKEEAVILFGIFNPNGYDANYAYDYLMVNYWKGDGTVCFAVTGNKINGFDTETYYKKNEEQYGKIYRFKDLIAKEGIIGAFKGTPVYADSRTVRMADGTIIGEFGTGGFCDGFRGGKIPTPPKPVSIEEQFGLPKGVSIHDLPIESLYRPMNIEIQPLELVRNEEQAKNIAERLAKELNGMLGVSFTKKEEKKMPTKFTFYVKEGTRPDKKCNGTIPTMTTNIELFDGNVFDYVTTIRGSATCDKADYDERQGVLEALANAVCGGEFEKRYSKAVKANKDADLWLRTCHYCGQVLDTREEREAHEAWHVERKKARRERYLLRKRAKEIAFEEQAQKMAKEMIEK